MMCWNYLAYYLVEWRTKADMSQQQVSDILGLDSLNQIIDWENGHNTPPLFQLVRLFRVYRIPQKEFIEVLMKFEKQQIYQALATLEG